MSDINLTVELREGTGTGAARAARRAGQVPGVIYGGDLGPVAIQVPQNEVLKAINSGQFLDNMIQITHSGKSQNVITKDVQFHPVSDMPVHLDFFRVNLTDIIAIAVGVELIGEDDCPGLRKGGTLNMVRHEIEVECQAGNIPDAITVDVSKLDIGDIVHFSDVTFPKGVTPVIDDRDPTILTVVASRTESAEEEDGEVAANEVPATAQSDDDESEEA